jgi:hypothetical protein
VLEGKQGAHGVEEAKPGRRAGVALVAMLDRGPLVARHGTGARVGEQVDEDIGGVQAEKVHPGGRERRAPFVLGR